MSEEQSNAEMDPQVAATRDRFVANAEAAGDQDTVDYLKGTPFTSLAELSKGYQELRSKFSSSRPGTPEESNEEPTAEVPETTQEESSTEAPEELKLPETAEDLQEAVGNQLDLDAIGQRWLDNGQKFAEADLKEITSKFQIDEAFAQRIIEGQYALAQQTQSASVQMAVDMAGSVDALNGALQWGADNYPQDEAQYINEVFSSGDMRTKKMVLKGLLADYNASQTQARKSTTQGLETIKASPLQGDPSGEHIVVTSREQFRSLIRKPEYAKDPEYRNKVNAAKNKAVANGTYSTERVRS